MTDRVREDPPPDVAAIRRQLKQLYDTTLAPENKKVGTAKFGVYAFYDFDGEPIYVGQTRERLRGRIGRHLTNQRTDAVAMFVLDPFEVRDVEMWPFFEFDDRPASDAEARQTLDRAEFTVYEKALADSKFDAVLNEKRPREVAVIELPRSVRGSIIPDDLQQWRGHPDVRIARRASTIANLARVICERGTVNPGLRHTLLVQARRLNWLVGQRLEQLGAELPTKESGEETGDEQQSNDA